MLDPPKLLAMLVCTLPAAWKDGGPFMGSDPLAAEPSERPVGGSCGAVPA